MKTNGAEFLGHAVVVVLNGVVMCGGLAERVEGGWVEVREYPAVEAVVAATLEGRPVPKGRVDQWPLSAVHFDAT